MSLPLTKKQQAVLDFIKSEIEQKGFPPTLDEMAMHFTFKSQNSVTCHLNALRNKGYIKTAPGTSRGIKVLEQEQKSGRACPHCGGNLERAA